MELKQKLKTKLFGVKIIFFTVAALLLIVYLYTVFLGFSISSFVGAAILAVFPIILLDIFLLLRWKKKKKQKKEKVPLYNKPDFAEKNEYNAV